MESIVDIKYQIWDLHDSFSSVASGGTIINCLDRPRAAGGGGNFVLVVVVVEPDAGIAVQSTWSSALSQRVIRLK